MHLAQDLPVLDPGTIYRKTPRGADAIGSRAVGLAPRQRALLILVDGKRSVPELAVLGAASGDPAALLQALLEEGLIEAGPLRSASGQAMPAVARPAAPLGPNQLAVPLARAQAFAVAELSDLLGPEGEDLCRQLAATRSPHAFRAAVRRTESHLREIVGGELAADFSRKVEGLRA